MSAPAEPEAAEAPSGSAARGALGGLYRLLDARSGAAATVLTLATSGLILALNIGTGVLSARLLGPAGRGELAAIVIWPQFLAFTLTLGLPSSLLYNLKCHEDRAGQLLSAALLIGSVMGMLAIAAGAVVIPHRLTEYTPDLVAFARWAMVTAPVPLFFVVFTSALLARHEFFLYNIARVLNPLTTLVGLVALAVGGLLTPRTAAMATLAGGVPIVTWMLVRLWMLCRPVWTDLGWALRRLTSYGIRAYGADLLGTLTEQIDKVVVVGLIDPGSMGLYVVAVSFALMLNVFPTAVVSVLFPKSSGRSMPEVVEATGRAARVSLAASAATAAFTALLAPWIVGRIFGRDFAGAVPVLRILLLEGVIRGLVWILVQAFMALNKPGLVSALQGVGLGLTIPLMFLLIPPYGLVGAGLALLISTTTRLLLVLACFPAVLKSAPPGLWPRWSEFDALLQRGWRQRPSPPMP